MREPASQDTVTCTSVPAAAQSLQHLPELDGIRGIAILLVVYYHAGQFVPDGGLQDVYVLVCILGWCGVDLFFVLSGFLITGILLDTRESPDYFRSFYGRRAVRIVPLYAVFLLLYFHVAIPLAHHLGKWPEISSAGEIWFWTYLTNWRAAWGYEYKNISHFWTLAIEEQFYLVWPAVVFFAGRRSLRWVCLSLIAGSLLLRSFWDIPGERSMLMATPMRVDSLAFGALAALLMRDPQWAPKLAGWTGKAAAASFLLLLGVFWLARDSAVPTDPRAPYVSTYGLTLLGVLFTCLVLRCALKQGVRFRSLMRWRPLRRMGKYSYCIYVVHLPISYFCIKVENAWRTGRGLGSNIPLSLFTTAACVALSYGVALVSWNLLERRFLELKKYFPYRNGPSKICA